VSPQWRDEAAALVSPRGTALRLVRRGLRPVARLTEHSRGEDALGEPWRAPLAALGDALRTLPRRTRCRVIVSSAFARYALVPFSTTLVDRKSNEALAGHVFRHIHGEQAGAWTCRVAPAAAGRKRLACAFDSALVGAIESAAQSCGVALVAIEPALVAAFNSAHRALPNSCWFAAVEADRLVLGLLLDGEWTHLAAERCPSRSEEALTRMLARESLLVAPGLLKRDLPCWIARFDDSASASLQRFEVRPPGASGAHPPDGHGAKAAAGAEAAA
jgi:hypothetical protein